MCVCFSEVLNFSWMFLCRTWEEPEIWDGVIQNPLPWCGGCYANLIAWEENCLGGELGTWCWEQLCLRCQCFESESKSAIATWNIQDSEDAVLNTKKDDKEMAQGERLMEQFFLLHQFTFGWLQSAAMMKESGSQRGPL